MQTPRQMRASVPSSAGEALLRRLPPLAVTLDARAMRRVYPAALLVWLATRIPLLPPLVSHPWTSGTAVATGLAILDGNWETVVRPPLPALLGAVLLWVGADPFRAVILLYVLASGLQFAAYALFVRLLFGGQAPMQVLALLLFLVVPYHHTTHHYLNVPVLLASAAVLLLSAHWLWAVRRASWSRAAQAGSLGWVTGALLLGVWSRAEVVTFVGVLAVLALLGIRHESRRAWRRPLPHYAVGLVVAAGSLLLLLRVAGADPRAIARYQVYTFLDSTPLAWISPECQVENTEACRVREAERLFGPLEQGGGFTRLVADQPALVLAKSLLSARDNLWAVFGPNPTTYPGLVPLVAAALLVSAAARAALRRVWATAWPVALAALATSILPPLSWAPAWPHYHLYSIIAVAIVAVPVLGGVAGRRGDP